MKKNYFNRLSNKDNFSFDNSKYIDSDLQEICDELKNFGVKEEQITKNISEIKKIAKIYYFTKNNLDKIKSIFNFENFLTTLKNKIIEKNIHPFIIAIYNFIKGLDISFYRINDNLKRIKKNEKIKIDKSDELTKTYDNFINKINNTFQIKEKELKNIVNQIIDNKDNENFYKDFVNKFNELCSFLNNTYKEFSRKINNLHKIEIIKYSLDNIYKHEYLVSMNFKDFLSSVGGVSYITKFGGLSVTGLSLLGGILSLTSELSLMSFITGFSLLAGVFIPTFLLSIPLAYLLNKFLDNRIRKVEIHNQFKLYFDMLNSRKKRIIDKVEELYKNSLNDIKNLWISQEIPMSNIYNKNKEFEEIQKNFQNICIENII